MGNTKFIAKVEVHEVDLSAGTGRAKDERNIVIELADFTVRDESLDGLKAKLVKHIELI